MSAGAKGGRDAVEAPAASLVHHAGGGAGLPHTAKVPSLGAPPGRVGTTGQTPENPGRG